MKVRTAASLKDISPSSWDACAPRANPFLHHAFLRVLEESRSVGTGTGWLPAHLVVEDGRDVVGVAPAYLKTHSWGEYVFDHAWAEAYSRAGGQYYPKLQLAVPFTPVTGERLLVHPEADHDVVMNALRGGVEQLARSQRLSSAHATFPTRAQWEVLGKQGWLMRTGVQFFWDNHDYQSFDAFLGTLSSRKRKMIRKERQGAVSDVTVRTITGADITAAHLDAMHAFYVSTIDRKWGSAYLTPSFFHLLHGAMPERVVLTMAFQGDKPVAGAFHLLGDDTLFGRHWGCSGNFEFLHFECCYYQAMDLAISRGLKRVEAGAQGVHKVSRGYLPAETYSAHFVVDSDFRAAVARALERERLAVHGEIAELMLQSPFRRE